MPPSRSVLHGRRLALAAVALPVCGALALASVLGWLAPLELRARDALLRLRGGEPPAAERIVLVRIREADIARHGHPLPDATLAAALQRILAAGPRVVGVDLYRDRSVGPGAEALRQAFRADRRLVLIEKLPEGAQPGTPAPGWIEDPGQVAFSDVVLDRDGVVRRGLLLMWDPDGRPHVSLAMRLALLHLADLGVTPEAADDAGERIVLGAVSLAPFWAGGTAYADADDGGYQILLDHRRGAAPFPSFPFDDLAAGRVPAEALRDRIVLLGTSAPSVTDTFATPFSSPSGPVLPAAGFEVHARLADQLLRHALDGDPPVRGLGTGAELLAVGAAALLGAGVGLLAPSLAAVGVAALLGLALWGAAVALALAQALWLPLVAPGLAWLSATGLGVGLALRAERHDKAALRDLFSRHVSPAVMEELWQQRDRFMEDGQVRAQRSVVTVLMLDLEGYTPASEKLDPAALMAWVNEFLSTMAGLVEAHGGVVDDYFGDGLKANFTVPVPRREEAEIRRDAARAVACAREMARAIEHLSERWRHRGHPEGRIRIGIHTGSVVLGSVGGSARLKYTSVGDAVNVAARLEQEARNAPVVGGSRARILVSGDTVRCLDETSGLTALGRRRLAGRAEPVPVFQLSAPADASVETSA